MHYYNAKMNRNTYTLYNSHPELKFKDLNVDQILFLMGCNEVGSQSRQIIFYGVEQPTIHVWNNNCIFIKKSVFFAAKMQAI